MENSNILLVLEYPIPVMSWNVCVFLTRGESHTSLLPDPKDGRPQVSSSPFTITPPNHCNKKPCITLSVNEAGDTLENIMLDSKFGPTVQLRRSFVRTVLLQITHIESSVDLLFS